MVRPPYEFPFDQPPGPTSVTLATVVLGTVRRTVKAKFTEEFISLGDYIDFDETPADGTNDFTTELNLALEEAAGRPLFFPGDSSYIYRFTTIAMDDLAVKGFGYGARYKLYQTEYTNETLVSIAVANSDTVLHKFSPTPEYLFAPPGTVGTRNLNRVNATGLNPSFSPEHNGALFIQGNDIGANFRYINGAFIEGQLLLNSLVDADTFGIYGRRSFLNSDHLNRVYSFGAENGLKAFSAYPHDIDHAYFGDLAGAIASDVGLMWTGGGYRAWLEEDDPPWAPATLYNKGTGATDDSLNPLEAEPNYGYHCLVTHTSSGSFADDFELGYWRDVGPRIKSAWTPGFEGEPAYLTVVGRAGTMRLPRAEIDGDVTNAWNMGTVLHGRDLLHMIGRGSNNVLDGYKMNNAYYSLNAGGLGTYCFINKGGRYIDETYWMGHHIGMQMVVSKQNVFVGARVARYPSRARLSAIGGDGSGAAIGCSNDEGDNPLTWTLADGLTGGVWAAEYLAVWGAANLQRSTLGASKTSVLGWNNLSFVDRSEYDIVAGTGNVNTPTAGTGHRFVIGHNLGQNTSIDNFLLIGDGVVSDATRAVIAADLEFRGVVINSNVASNMNTAVNCDRVTGAFTVFDRATGALPYFHVADDGAIWLNGVALTAIYQPIDGDLSTIAALTPADDDFLQRKAGGWVNRTIAQVKTDLGI